MFTIVALDSTLHSVRILNSLGPREFKIRTEWKYNNIALGCLNKYVVACVIKQGMRIYNYTSTSNQNLFCSWWAGTSGNLSSLEIDGTYISASGCFHLFLTTEP